MTDSSKSPRRQPEPVPGVVFKARMPWGTVEVLGIPFEHVGRQWAIHMAVNDNALRPRWVVSDVRTGAKLPGVAEASIEEARKAAVRLLDTADKDKLKRAITKFARKGISRPSARQRTKSSAAAAATLTP